jgi:hypothetical protein
VRLVFRLFMRLSALLTKLLVHCVLARCSTSAVFSVCWDEAVGVGQGV